MTKRALILVDIQPDFMPGGPLAVPEGDAILPVVRGLIDRHELVVATQDWHPREHGSFAANHEGRSPGEVIDLHGLAQVLWPIHCVQDTPGAALVDSLGKISAVFRKGSDPKVDSYSGFFDNGRRNSTGMGEWLKAQGVDALTIVGLATDYCVKFTALDAIELGFATTVVRDACRAVNLREGDDERALAEVVAAGGQVIESKHMSTIEFEPQVTIAEGRWLRLAKRGRWEFAQRVIGGTAAILVATTDDDEIVLIEQPRPALAAMVIELPAGLIGDHVGSEDEPAELAAARELEEETGFVAASLERIGEGVASAGLSDEKMIVFRAKGLTRVGPGGGDEHEQITVHVVKLDAVEGWIAAQQARGCVVDLKIFAGLYFARR
ncbi:bifunctional nicotinamidase/pyrazinamidase [Nannocystaceae bacterium ST9]